MKWFDRFNDWCVEVLVAIADWFFGHIPALFVICVVPGLVVLVLLILWFD